VIQVALTTSTAVPTATEEPHENDEQAVDHAAEVLELQPVEVAVQ
jgi:hypothetical protein